MRIKETIERLGTRFKKFRQVFRGEESLNKTYSSHRIFSTEEQAIHALENAKRKLFRVNLWNLLSGPQHAKFTLYNEEGNPYHSPIPRINDYIKIVLPGPFPENWVQVVNVKEEENFAEFTVRPSNHPDHKDPTYITEHFFKSKATSTFRVERKGRRIKAYEIGYQEEINKNVSEAGDRSEVNTLIAGGGWAGFQKIQWKSLTDFLVSP